MLNERLELGNRGFGKVLLRDSRKRRDMVSGLLPLRSSGPQEDAWARLLTGLRSILRLDVRRQPLRRTGIVRTLA